MTRTPDPAVGEYLRRRHVVALIPAHDEEDTIAATLEAMRAQTVPVDRLVVVADNCVDQTAAMARRCGAEVFTTVGNRDKKAGALNQALAVLLPQLAAHDHLLVTDADSILAPRFVEEALGALDADPWVGAVCASFYAQPRPGLWHLLQRNEYSRFARMISRKRERAQVLSGVGTLFPVRTLREIAAARAAGLLPGTPGVVYHTGCATEDIELTFAVRELGYRPLAPDGCRAVTDTMPTAGKLWHQRIRWQRGMLDSIRAYGLHATTLPSVARVALMYLASLSVPAYLAFLAVAALHYQAVPFDVRWSPLLALFVAERVWTVRRDGWRSVATAALFVPEWCYEQFRGFAYWVALWRSVRGKERVWVAT